MESVEISEGEKINFRQDVFKILQPPVTFSMGFKRPYGVDSATVLISLGHKGRDVLTKLIETSPLTLARELQGADVYDAPVPGIVLALTDDQVFVGTTPEVEAAIQARQGGLASTPEFRAVAASAPADAWFTMFVDSRKLTDAVLGLLDKRAELEQAGMAHPSAYIALSMIGAYGDTLTPENADQMRKLLPYYSTGFLTIRTTPDGLHLRLTQLRPAD
jgi:hypothetical protein